MTTEENLKEWVKTQNALKLNLMGIGHNEMISFAEYHSKEQNKELVELLNKIGGDLIGLNLSEGMDKDTINVITAAIDDAIQKNSKK